MTLVRFPAQLFNKITRSLTPPQNEKHSRLGNKPNTRKNLLSLPTPIIYTLHHPLVTKLHQKLPLLGPLFVLSFPLLPLLSPHQTTQYTILATMQTIGLIYTSALTLHALIPTIPSALNLLCLYAQFPSATIVAIITTTTILATTLLHSILHPTSKTLPLNKLFDHYLFSCVSTTHNFLKSTIPSQRTFTLSLLPYL